MKPVQHIDYLNQIYKLYEKHVADVGAGDGQFSMHMHELGAKVTAIEIDKYKVEHVKSKTNNQINFLLGTAENLPLESVGQDLLCFFFSFHHVPINVHDKALIEAHRVLNEKGRLHIVEPLPEGSMFDVVKLVEDETFVRTQSHKRMHNLTNEGMFELKNKKEYTLTREYPDFETFLDKIVRNNTERSAKLPLVRDKMEEIFVKVVTQKDATYYLDQPCIAYHFIKV